MISFSCPDSLAQTFLFLKEVRAGFTWGQVRIAKLQDDELEDATDAANGHMETGEYPDSTMLIPFQNENLCAYVEYADGSRKVRNPEHCINSG